MGWEENGRLCIDLAEDCVQWWILVLALLKLKLTRE
jgi:hypothetical protein